MGPRIAHDGPQREPPQRRSRVMYLETEGAHLRQWLGRQPS